jgi:hypothetical protein
MPYTLSDKGGAEEKQNKKTSLSVFVFPLLKSVK